MSILKRFDKKLFWVLFFTLLLPTLYRTVRIYFLADIPGDWGFNIASQLQWINVIFEVLQEALILPLFFLIGKTIKDDELTKKKIVSGTVVLFVIITFFSLLLGIFANGLTTFMSQSEELIPATVSYIRLELVGIILMNVAKFGMVVLIEKDMFKELLVLLGIEMILTMGLDYFFIGNSVTRVGVNGIAYTNIIINAVKIGMYAYVFHKVFNIFKNLKSSFELSTLKDWRNVGVLSGLESFVRNAAFVLMILRIVNEVGGQGAFWVMMNFIWGWLLLPVLALGDLIKKEASQSRENISNNYKTYMLVTTIFIAVWAISIPIWRWFMGSAMNLEGDFLNQVYGLSLISLIFYVVFAYNNVIDSIFYGVGRTDLMLYQSLAVNIIYYGAMFILYRTGVFVPTLNSIAIMFGVGMTLDSILTYVQFRFFVKKENLAI